MFVLSEKDMRKFVRSEGWRFFPYTGLYWEDPNTKEKHSLESAYKIAFSRRSN